MAYQNPFIGKENGAVVRLHGRYVVVRRSDAAGACADCGMPTHIFIEETKMEKGYLHGDLAFLCGNCSIGG